MPSVIGVFPDHDVTGVAGEMVVGFGIGLEFSESEAGSFGEVEFDVGTGVGDDGPVASGTARWDFPATYDPALPITSTASIDVAVNVAGIYATKWNLYQYDLTPIESGSAAGATVYGGWTFSNLTVEDIQFLGPVPEPVITISFDATTSDPASYSFYTIDWGDGTVDTYSPVGGDPDLSAAQTINQTHAYVTPGFYTVNVTRDRREQTLTLLVNATYVYLTLTLPSGVTTDSSNTYSVTAHVIPDGAVPVASPLTMFFGDDTSVALPVDFTDPSAPTASTSHVYLFPGSPFNVRATGYRSDDGGYRGDDSVGDLLFVSQLLTVLPGSPARTPLAWRQRHDGAATPGPTLAQISATGGDRPTFVWRQQTP